MTQHKPSQNHQRLYLAHCSQTTTASPPCQSNFTVILEASDCEQAKHKLRALIQSSSTLEIMPSTATTYLDALLEIEQIPAVGMITYYEKLFPEADLSLGSIASIFPDQPNDVDTGYRAVDYVQLESGEVLNIK